MEKIVITGYKGNIGQVLANGLQNIYSLILLDLPETNLIQKENFKEKIIGANTIIHLAWNSKGENVSNDLRDENNLLMVKNILQTAKEKKIKRVILASSVNVHNINRNLPFKINLETPPNPKSKYGEDKVKIEKLGKEYSKFLEIVCVRFGGVAPLSHPWGDCDYVGLSYNDCIDLIKNLIKTKIIPDNYQIIYGVSNNELGIHDLKNFLNWIPKDDAKDFYKK